jgi:hypothetical protein
VTQTVRQERGENAIHQQTAFSTTLMSKLSTRITSPW